MHRSAWGYLVVWEFYVSAGQEQSFEKVYGPGGDWARLFKGSEAYLGTELVRDVQNRARYVTLDFWASRGAYAQFRASHKAEYEAIDARCEMLTEQETEVGTLERIS